MVSMYYDARVLRNMRLHTPTGRYSTQAIQNVVELNAVMELTCVAIAGPNRSLKVIVEIVGLKGVEDALSQAGPKLAGRALRKALVASANPFEAAAKKNVPDLAKATTNRNSSELRDAIDKTVKLSNKQETGIARVGTRRGKGKGNQSPSVSFSFVDFASIHGAAQEFRQPILRSHNCRFRSRTSAAALGKIAQTTIVEGNRLIEQFSVNRSGRFPASPVSRMRSRGIPYSNSAKPTADRNRAIHGPHIAPEDLSQMSRVSSDQIRLFCPLDSRRSGTFPPLRRPPLGWILRTSREEPALQLIVFDRWRLYN